MFKKNFFIVIALMLFSMQSHALEKKKICIFDLIGANGDYYSIMKDMKPAALGWGVELELVPYTDEKVATEDLKAKQCDGAFITGIRARQFISYTGSTDSIRGIPNYDVLRSVISILASGHEKLEDKMVSGPYQYAGMVPMGSAYLFVKEQITDLDGMAGKSIAVLEYDEAEAYMARKVGMSPMMSDITNFSSRFNNGSVDVCFAPIFGYSALELYKGMAPDGGVMDYILGQLTSQLVIRKDAFPEGFALEARKFLLGQFDRAMRVVDNAANEVDDKWWISMDEESSRNLDQMMRKARIELTEKNVYDKDMMSFLYKVRCRDNPSNPECSAQSE